METIQSQIRENDEICVPVIVASRQSGGIRVNMYGVSGQDFYIDVVNVGDPEDKEFNFQLDGQEMLALGHPENPQNDPFHVFDHPCAYRVAKERYDRKLNGSAQFAG